RFEWEAAPSPAGGPPPRAATLRREPVQDAAGRPHVAGGLSDGDDPSAGELDGRDDGSSGINADYQQPGNPGGGRLGALRAGPGERRRQGGERDQEPRQR